MSKAYSSHNATYSVVAHAIGGEPRYLICRRDGDKWTPEADCPSYDAREKAEVALGYFAAAMGWGEVYHIGQGFTVRNLRAIMDTVAAQEEADWVLAHPDERDPRYDRVNYERNIVNIRLATEVWRMGVPIPDGMRYHRGDLPGED